MYPKRMMIAGVIIVIVAIAILAFALVMVGEEEDFIKKAARFDGGTAGTARQGDLVIVEGKVSAKNKILVHDFVDGAREHQVKGGSWSILKAYRQPVLADLAQGEIILASDKICNIAEGNNVLKTDEKSEWNHEVRYIGLRRGDPIAAVGTLASLAPAALDVKHWYSGSLADYKNYVTSSRKGSYIFFGVLVVIGAVLFILGFRKR